MTDKKGFAEAAGAKDKHSEALQLVAETLAQLRFGAIHLTVHDGKLVQLDITERKRFPA
jgi:hypothetical protein